MTEVPRYTYKYDPEAPMVKNISESMKMDAIRNEFAPTTEQLRNRVLAEAAKTNGVSNKKSLADSYFSDGIA
jgi:hypothetical protein